MKMQNLKLKIKNYKKIICNLQFAICNLQEGITLVTLALIVAIMLLLVIIGTVMFKAQDEKAIRNNVAHSCMNPIAKALEMYRIEEGDYPPGIAQLSRQVNIDTLKKSFRNPSYNNIPAEGLTITKPSGDSACAYGEIDGIAGEYEIMYCVGKLPNSAPYNLNMPICCWDKNTAAPNECNTLTNWYPCEEKM